MMQTAGYAPPTEPKDKEKRRAGMAGVAIALALVLALGGVLAYLTDAKQVVNNLFLNTNLDIELTEPTWEAGIANDENYGKGLVPTQQVAKDPTVKSVGTVPAYVAVKLTVPVFSGDVYDPEADEVSTKTDADLFGLNIQPGWTLKATGDVKDGFRTYTYLYETVLNQDDTALLFDTVTVSNILGDVGIDATQIIVDAYGIQADPFANASDAYDAYLTQNGQVVDEVSAKPLKLNAGAGSVDMNADPQDMFPATFTPGEGVSKVWLPGNPYVTDLYPESAGEGEDMTAAEKVVPFAREGYAFTGWTWTDAAGIQHTANVENPNAADWCVDLKVSSSCVETTANWKAVQYQVKFYANNGSDSEPWATKLANYETGNTVEMGPMSLLDYEGHEFLYWTASSAGTGDNFNGDSVISLTDLIAAAKQSGDSGMAADASGRSLGYYSIKDGSGNELYREVRVYAQWEEVESAIDVNALSLEAVKAKVPANTTKVVFSETPMTAGDDLSVESNGLFYGSASGTTYTIASAVAGPVKLPCDSSEMFAEKSNLTEIDLSGADSSEVENMGSFARDTDLMTAFTGDHWNIANVTNSKFFMSTDLENVATSEVVKPNEAFPTGKAEYKTAQVKADPVDGKTYVMKNPVDMGSRYYPLQKHAVNATNVVFTDMVMPSGQESIDFDADGDGGVIGWNDGNTLYISTQKPGEKVVANTSIKCLFSGLSYVTMVDVSGLDVSNVVGSLGVFKGLMNATEIQGYKEWDTSNFTSLSSAFSGCIKLSDIDISSWNTSNVTSMDNCFSLGTTSVTTKINMSNIDTSNVKSMYNLFANDAALTEVDMSGIDTRNVKNMTTMFSGCKNLKNIDTSVFNTSNVVDIRSMFYGCSSLTSLDVTKFNTSKVIKMDSMFANCTSIKTLDLSNFETSNVKSIGKMFNGCTSLTTIYASDLWVAGYDEDDSVFLDCTSLKGGKTAKYNKNRVSSLYARIDAGYPDYGYFTYRAATNKQISTVAELQPTVKQMTQDQIQETVQLQPALTA